MVAGARPNFMKVAPVMRALEGSVEVQLVHSGQHYDWSMSEAMFEDLSIPDPDINLEVGSGTHSEQTARVMLALEPVLTARRPDAIVVVGDVNSTLAAALTAAKLGIPIAHVEAGLRSRDWSMPEEINRVLTDRLSDWLFTPSSDADANLVAEGIPIERIHLVGNVMIDTLMEHLPRARDRLDALKAGLRVDGRYALLTLHRPSNVDHRVALARIARAIGELSEQLPVVFPAHPRTVQRLNEWDIELAGGVRRTEPLGYLDFLGLMSGAGLVLTDSGGIQEETSALGVPCVTLRDNTERPITCDLGTNRVAGGDPYEIVRVARLALEENETREDIPLWDGEAGKRVASVLIRDLVGIDIDEKQLTGEVV